MSWLDSRELARLKVRYSAVRCHNAALSGLSGSPLCVRSAHSAEWYTEACCCYWCRISAFECWSPSESGGEKHSTYTNQPPSPDSLMESGHWIERGILLSLDKAMKRKAGRQQKLGVLRHINVVFRKIRKAQEGICCCTSCCYSEVIWMAPKDMNLPSTHTSKAK